MNKGGHGVTLNADSVLNTPAGEDLSFSDRLDKDNDYVSDSSVLDILLTSDLKNVMLNDEIIILVSSQL